MKELQTFENERFGELRTYTDDNGNIWFCAKDIAAALGYSNSSTPAALFQAVPTDWKAIKPFDSCNEIKQMMCVSEPGFYFFLGRSDKPKALPYQKWVAGEVIPAIRKNGEYRLPDAAPANPVSGKTSDDLINARIQVVTLRIMGGLSIYTPALRMKFLAEAASLMSGKPMSEYLPPEEDSKLWVAASGLARLYGLSNAEIGRLLKKRGVHGTQDETREWSRPICYPARGGSRRVIGYLYNLEFLGPLLERTLEESQPNLFPH